MRKTTNRTYLKRHLLRPNPPGVSGLEDEPGRDDEGFEDDAGREAEGFGEDAGRGADGLGDEAGLLVLRLLVRPPKSEKPLGRGFEGLGAG